MPVSSDAVASSLITAVQRDFGVSVRRAASAIAWSCCHLLCHWLQDRSSGTHQACPPARRAGRRPSGCATARTSTSCPRRSSCRKTPSSACRATASGRNDAMIRPIALEGLAAIISISSIRRCPAVSVTERYQRRSNGGDHELEGKPRFGSRSARCRHRIAFHHGRGAWHGWTQTRCPAPATPECGLLHKHDTPAMGGNGHPRAEQQYRAPASQRQQQWAE